MNLYIVSIHDRKLEAFGAPACVTAIGAAIRGFQDAINDPASQFNKHPEDYSLHQLATWNDATGHFTNLQDPKQLALGDELIQK